MNWEEHDSFDREMEATEEKAAEQKTPVSAMREKIDLQERKARKKKENKKRFSEREEGKYKRRRRKNKLAPHV